MIRAIFFDFDRCLFDTASMGMDYLREPLSILEQSIVPKEIQDQFKKRMHITDFDEALRFFAIPEDIAEAMRSAYENAVAPKGVLYDDVHTLAELPVIKILVTSGFRKFQEQKITNSGIAQYFDDIIIDAFDVGEKREGKQRIFERLLESYGFSKDEVLVVGDKPSSELAAARALGITAIQIVRPGTSPWDDTEHCITSLSELHRFVF